MVEQTYKQKVKAEITAVEEARAKREYEIMQRQKSFTASRTGRFGSGIAKAFGAIRSPARASYQAGMLSQATQKKIRTARGYLPPPKRTKVTFQGQRYDAPGRPRGTTKYVDPKTGQKIGVYEYRAILRARLRQEKIAAMQRANITPEQQAVLNRIEMQERQRSMNEEARLIPNTKGFTPLRSFTDEINDAASILD